MEAFTKWTAKAAPIDAANVDTDQIVPAPFLSRIRTEGYEGLLFYRVRRNADGSMDPDFILNQDAFKDAGILVADRNFGCGSSRENAAWTLWDNGIRSVIAPSFGDIHYNNEMNNGMVPVMLSAEICADLRQQLHDNPGAEITVDLENNVVVAPDGKPHVFSIPEFNRYRLLNGLDDVSFTLESETEIAAYEAKRKQEADWLY
ncbi:MAG: 3-isopropylmalate dehydratase small subunit [Alphaproteobacteria bacterium]|nr:3-isopropylmalate dehydratase small subunit [Alphaproteobacteria bacterium]